MPRSTAHDLASDDRTRTSFSYHGAGPSWFLLDGGAAAVVVKLGAEARDVPLAEADRREVLLAREPATISAASVTLPGHDVVVRVLRGPDHGDGLSTPRGPGHARDLAASAHLAMSHDPNAGGAGELARPSLRSLV